MVGNKPLWGILCYRASWSKV